MKTFGELTEKERKIKILKADAQGKRYIEMAGEILGEHIKEKYAFGYALIAPNCDDPLLRGVRWKIELRGWGNTSSNIKNYAQYLWDLKFFGMEKARKNREKSVRG